jgi:peptidoglycan hydrolase CwlO-like protein
MERVLLVLAIAIVTISAITAIAFLVTSHKEVLEVSKFSSIISQLNSTHEAYCLSMTKKLDEIVSQNSSLSSQIEELKAKLAEAPNESDYAVLQSLVDKMNAAISGSNLPPSP